jgi:hypothetical protein
MAEKPERRLAQIVSFILVAAIVLAFSYATLSAIFSHQTNHLVISQASENRLTTNSMPKDPLGISNSIKKSR